jgi:FXSXX-COOH protein
MDRDSIDPGPDDGDRSPLIDVSDMRLDQLLPSADTVLARSLSALVDETTRPQEIIAAFGNFAPDDPPPSD